MRKELEDKLFNDFPKVLQRCDDMTKSCMYWGIECGDGWYDILRDLCEKLTKEIENTPNAEDACYTASQVKEKYGTLRFYMNNSTKAMEDLIDKAEYETSQTCDVCGNPGRANKLGWVSVRCDGHRD